MSTPSDPRPHYITATRFSPQPGAVLRIVLNR